MLERGNKKAQGMSTSTIILLVLGIAILVILIIGFTQGWGQIAPWLSQDNVDQIKNACMASATTGGDTNFCYKTQDLKFEGEEVETTCAILAVVDEFEKYGIEESDFDCKQNCNNLEINGKTGEIKEVSQNIGACSDILTSDDCTLLRGCKWINDACIDAPKSQGLKECSEFSNSDDCIEVGCDWENSECLGSSQSISNEEGAYDVSLLANDLGSGQRCLIMK